MNDLSAVRSIGSWNLSSGFLQTFAWTADFNPHTVQQTVAQTWIRLHGLAREYWRPVILFEIAGALGTRLALDEVTKKRIFGHYARVLIEIDITSDMHERILVERKDFDFYVDVEYEKLPSFCDSCKIIGHSFKNCKYQIPSIVQAVKTTASNVKNVDTVSKTPTGTPNIVAGCSKTVVEIYPLINDIIRSKAVTNCDFVGNVLNHEEDASNISVARVLDVHPLQVDNSVLNGKQAVVHQDNNSMDLRIVGPWCDAITELDYHQDSPPGNVMIPCDEVVAAD